MNHKFQNLEVNRLLPFNILTDVLYSVYSTFEEETDEQWMNRFSKNLFLTSNINCVYCGDWYQCRDHPVSVAWSGYKRSYKPGEVVPACQDCNSRLNDVPIFDLDRRARYLKPLIEKRFRKWLELPEWEEEQLSNMGYNLTTQIHYSMMIREITILRLKNLDLVADGYSAIPITILNPKRTELNEVPNKKRHKDLLRSFICDECGKKCSTQYPNQRFCSEDCSQKYHNFERAKPSHLQNCKNCDTQFSTTLSKKKFCSDKCANEYRNSNELIKNCETCNKEFTTHWDVRIDFCSEECAKEFNR